MESKPIQNITILDDWKVSFCLLKALKIKPEIVIIGKSFPFFRPLDPFSPDNIQWPAEYKIAIQPASNVYSLKNV